MTAPGRPGTALVIGKALVDIVIRPNESQRLGAGGDDEGVPDRQPTEQEGPAAAVTITPPEHINDDDALLGQLMKEPRLGISVLDSDDFYCRLEQCQSYDTLH